jgi:ubiquinone/menaquinone biosynthesis C-methylase UbiE
MKYIAANLLYGDRNLDFGCGRGDDVVHLRSNLAVCSMMNGLPTPSTTWECYDPHYFPRKPVGLFDVVTCHYVLNTLPEDEWEGILTEIKSYLKKGGIAYITVRRDRKRLNGYTSKLTYQTLVVLDLPVVHTTHDFCIYKLRKV